MNQKAIYFDSTACDSKDFDLNKTGESYLNFKKLPNYRKRHKDDFDNKPFLAKLYSNFSVVIYAIIATSLILRFIAFPGHIPSESMVPTLNVADIIVINRLAYKFDAPERGDIVIFKHDSIGNYKVIKRVIGLPGDVIDIKNNRVYINGCLYEERYAVGDTMESMNGITHYEVPENHVFLLGDNREHSADARYWDDPFVSYDEIIGKLCLHVAFSDDGKTKLLKGEHEEGKFVAENIN